jgi:hypothetical protein
MNETADNVGVVTAGYQQVEVHVLCLCCIFNLDCGRIVIMCLLLEIHKLVIHILTSHICISSLLLQKCPK